MDMTKIIVMDEVNKAKEKAKLLFPNSSIGISKDNGKHCLKINMPKVSRMTTQHMPSIIEGIPVKYDFVGEIKAMIPSSVKIRLDLDKNTLNEETINKLLSLYTKDDEKISFIIEAAKWNELANELSSLLDVSIDKLQGFKNIEYFVSDLTKEQLVKISKSENVHYIFKNKQHKM